MAKQRNHNEWFRTVSCGGRKSCPGCGEKLDPGESIWSWGQYIRVKWHTVMHFCNKCFPTRVQQGLVDHTDECGCTVTLVGYQGTRLPKWLTLKVTCPVKTKAA